MAKKRLMTALAAGTLMVGLLPGVVSATPSVPPLHGCPNGGGWVLTPVYQAQFTDNIGNLGDQNGDTWACRKANPGRDGVFVWKDNTNGPPPPP